MINIYIQINTNTVYEKGSAAILYIFRDETMYLFIFGPQIMKMMVFGLMKPHSYLYIKFYN